MPELSTSIPLGNRGALEAFLDLPDAARAVVVFVHGSGSSRLSPRNQAVARDLNRHGFGTLLFDLLTEHESNDRRNVFDIELLARRLVTATSWLRARPDTAQLPVAYFGASTGAAAALVASTQVSPPVAAIVSRGGRPDLAGRALRSVTTPVLFIVGGADTEVLRLTRAVQQVLTCENRLEIVPGASHLFEEPGALAQVEALSRAWFAAHVPDSG